jgi:hypothetical protein
MVVMWVRYWPLVRSFYIAELHWTDSGCRNWSSLVSVYVCSYMSGERTSEILSRGSFWQFTEYLPVSIPSSIVQGKGSFNICQLNYLFIYLFWRSHLEKYDILKYSKTFFIFLHKSLSFKKVICENFSISKNNINFVTKPPRYFSIYLPDTSQKSILEPILGLSWY